MKLVFVKGVHFGNKGAELMLLAVNERLQSSQKNLEIVLAPSPQASFKKRMEFQAYQFFNLGKGKFDGNWMSYYVPNKLRGFLRKRFGIVFEVDLDAILDASGFAYGDNWPSENTKRARNQAMRMRRKGMKYIFLPQAFGPFSRPDDVKNIKEAIEASYLKFSRDRISQKYLNDIGVDIPLGEDFTSTVVTETSGTPAGLFIVPNSNMLRGKMNWSKERYFDTILDVVKTFSNECPEPIYVMNHEGESDLEACEELVELVLSNGIICTLSEPESALEAKQALSNARLVFSSRYHACISALSSGVPCIGTSWSHKYEELYRDYAVPELLIEADDASKTIKLVGKILAENTDIIERLQTKAKQNKIQSQELLDRCLTAIEAD